MARKASIAKQAEAALPGPGAAQGLDAQEIVEVTSRRVACDGVGGALGHPRVWLEMGAADFVECLYCDRRFVLSKGSKGKENVLLTPADYEGPGGH
jgi:uncharacterized Zn-finger protein